MTRPLSLALVQAPARREREIDGFGREVERLKRRYPATQLFVYPELHLCSQDASDPDQDPPLNEALAEPLDGPRGRMLAEIAGDLNVWLIPGSVYERGENGAIYNTSPVYSPAGRLVASYRKVFPWRPYERSTPGDRFVVFNMDGFGRVGLSICYDSWFPESTRHLAWMGAELVVNIARTGTIDRAQELVLARANAIVNQVIFASVNAAAPDGLGLSLICDAEGRVRMSAADSATQVLSDVVDLDEVVTARRLGTVGLNRPWKQLTNDDPPLALPLYAGELHPARWDPAGQAGTKDVESSESIAGHTTPSVHTGEVDRGERAPGDASPRDSRRHAHDNEPSSEPLAAPPSGHRWRSRALGS